MNTLTCKKTFRAALLTLIAGFCAAEISALGLYERDPNCDFGSLVPAGQANPSAEAEPMGMVWCFDLAPAPLTPTRVKGNNSWVDEFKTNIEMQEFNNGNLDYSMFNAGSFYKIKRFMNHNHWMTDFAGVDPDLQGPPWDFAATAMRPNMTFTAENGQLTIEADVAAAVPEYEGNLFWPEIVVTPSPGMSRTSYGSDFRRNGTYVYETFPNYWTLGCRLQTDGGFTCALLDNSDEGDSQARVFELSHFQCRNSGGPYTVGCNNMWGGLPINVPAEMRKYKRECGENEMDRNCRDRFRWEITRNRLTWYVNGVKYMEHWNFDPQAQAYLDNVLTKPVHVYFGEFMYKLGKPARSHWGRIAINPKDANGNLLPASAAVSPTFCADEPGQTCPMDEHHEEGGLAISNIAASNISATAATINFLTNHSATAMVNYGPTMAYGSQSNHAMAMTNHSITLSGLQPNTLYHYMIHATTPGAMAMTGDLTFRTLATGGGRPGDINGDGLVNVTDLSLLLAPGTWGSTKASADVNKDGTVGLGDLSLMLTNWSPAVISAQAFGAAPSAFARTGSSLLFSPRARKAHDAPIVVDIFLDAKEPVNAVQATVVYPDALHLLNVDVAASAFPVQAEHHDMHGTVLLVRGSQQALSGRLKLATLTFEGGHLDGLLPLTFTKSSLALKASDASNVLVQAKGLELSGKPSSQTFLTPVPADGVNDQVIFDDDAAHITVVDANGKRVYEAESLGGAALSWNGRDERGNLVPTGFYIAKVRNTGGETRYQKLILAK